MPVDHIRYDLLAQDALRGLVRQVLADVARKGLPGDHHFFISFDTQADGVRLSPRLREQYPEEMTIVLQHQFWDLKVNDEAFEVGLSFGGVAERLVVPFEAITNFADPSVQFQLQFQTIEEAAEEDGAAAAPAPAPAKTKGKRDEAKPRPPARHEPRANVPAKPGPGMPPAASPDAADESGPPDKPGGEATGQVVRLDRFRKK